MNVYILEAQPNSYQNIVPIQEESWDVFREFNGKSLSATWSPICVRILHDSSDNKNLRPGDFPSLASHVPVFDSQVLSVLGDILRKNGEILPLKCDHGDYFAYNVTKIIDALDMDNSEFKRFKTSNRIMRIVKYSFRQNLLDKASIFKLPQSPLSNVFVTDVFVERLRSSPFIGFGFNKIWSS